MNPPPPRRGRPPTDAERRWIEQAETDLSPAASLARIETTARLAFAAVVGTTGLITALGLTTTARDDLLENPAVLGMSWPMALLVASLLLAGIALVPSLRVDELSSPSEVAEFYRATILRRGALVLASMLLLAVGLATTLAAVIKPPRSGPALSTMATTRGTRLQVSATAHAEHLAGKALTLVVRRGSQGAVLCRAVQVAVNEDSTASCGPLSAVTPEISVQSTAGGATSSAIIRRGK